ncbi:hypothetical protein FHS30_001087 [Simiduia aestuariiviva]|uniref:Universal stress protein B n=1 Tax=Simiduia aestuariiviva TaxID=1510459 RepID=A0A839UMB4_9GAMM|nr:hypothetical protein [Simiduia aestuariiviva]
MIGETLALLALASFVIMVILLFVWGRKLSSLFEYLKAHCPSDFKALGNPHLVGNNTPTHTVKFIKYIHRGQHSDSTVEQYRVFLLKLFWLYFTLFVYLISYTLVSAFHS